MCRRKRSMPATSRSGLRFVQRYRPASLRRQPVRRLRHRRHFARSRLPTASSARSALAAPAPRPRAVCSACSKRMATCHQSSTTVADGSVSGCSHNPASPLCGPQSDDQPWHADLRSYQIDHEPKEGKSTPPMLRARPCDSHHYTTGEPPTRETRRSPIRNSEPISRTLSGQSRQTWGHPAVAPAAPAFWPDDRPFSHCVRSSLGPAIWTLCCPR
jgi:hypothetical protein